MVRNEHVLHNDYKVVYCNFLLPVCEDLSLYMVGHSCNVNGYENYISREEER